MAELSTYQFPSRPSPGVLFGLSAARLGAVGIAGVVLITTLSRPTTAGALTGLALIGLLLASAAVKVGGRAVVDWLPVWVGFGWQQATRNNEFYANPDHSVGLPEGTVDLPGELFGIEIHHFTGACRAAVANPTPAAYGIVRDTFRQRLVAIAEIAGDDFLFLDPADQQGRIGAWGRVLDHLAQSLPELSRVQIVHTVGPASTSALAAHQQDQGGRGDDRTAASYSQVLAIAGASSQQHRLLLAIGLDLRAARRAIRQAGGGDDGAARGADGPRRGCAALGRSCCPGVAAGTRDRGGATCRVRPGRGPVAGRRRRGRERRRRRAPRRRRRPSGDGRRLVSGPPRLRLVGDLAGHSAAWPSRDRRIPPAPADRRAGPAAPVVAIRPDAGGHRRAPRPDPAGVHRVRADPAGPLGVRHLGAAGRAWHDAAQREEDLVEGRTAYRVVWLVTITATTPTDLDTAVGQVEAAARRCSLDLRRLSGTQRQGFAFTLPLCRGAR